MEDDLMGLKVAKIIHNIQPGALETWGYHDTVGVIELPGMSCKEHGIKVGSTCILSER